MKRKYTILILALVLSLFCGSQVKAATKTPKLAKSRVTMTVGSKYTLKVKNKYKKVSYKTSKKSVATVTKKGVIKGKKKGSAVITATVKYKSGKKLKTKKLKCRVKVTKKSKETISEEEEDVYTGEIPDLETTSLSLTVGDTAKIKVTGTYKKILYKSYSTKYLRIDEKNMTVTALKAGNPSISIRIGYIGKQGTIIYISRVCNVTVKDKAPAPTPVPTPAPTPVPEQEKVNFYESGFTIWQYIDPITKEKKWPDWWLEFKKEVENGTSTVKRYDSNGYECEWELVEELTNRIDPTGESVDGVRCNYKLVDLIRPIVYDAIDPFEVVGVNYYHPATEFEKYLKKLQKETGFTRDKYWDKLTAKAEKRAYLFRGGSISDQHSNESGTRLLLFANNNMTFVGDNNFSNSNVIVPTEHYIPENIVFKGNHNLEGAIFTNVYGPSIGGGDFEKNIEDDSYSIYIEPGKISIIGDYNGTGSSLITWTNGAYEYTGDATLDQVIGNHNFSNFKGTNAKNYDSESGIDPKYARTYGFGVDTLKGDYNFASYGW